MVFDDVDGVRKLTREGSSDLVRGLSTTQLLYATGLDDEARASLRRFGFLWNDELVVLPEHEFTIESKEASERTRETEHCSNGAR